MAIEYRCENCGDRQPAWWNEEKDRWEAPRGWWELSQAEAEHFQHVCSPACVIGLMEAQHAERR
jgi:hypothetical protein